MLELKDEKLVHLDPSLTEWHYYGGNDTPGVCRLMGRDDNLYLIMLCEDFCTVLHITHAAYGQHRPLSQEVQNIPSIEPSLMVLDFEWVYEGVDMPYKQMIANGFLSSDDFMKFRQPDVWADKLPKLILHYYVGDPGVFGGQSE